MPAFRSSKPSWKLEQTVAHTVAAGAQDMVWDAAVFEDPVGWDGASTYVVDRDGLYLLHAQVGRAGVASGSAIIVRLRASGSTIQTFAALTTLAASNAAVTTVAQLDAGEPITVGVTLHPTISTTTNVAQCQFWGARIGPKRWT